MPTLRVVIVDKEKGFFGHEGRPGLVGGSAPAEGTVVDAAYEAKRARAREALRAHRAREKAKKLAAQQAQHESFDEQAFYERLGYKPKNTIVEKAIETAREDADYIVKKALLELRESGSARPFILEELQRKHGKEFAAAIEVLADKPLAAYGTMLEEHKPAIDILLAKANDTVNKFVETEPLKIRAPFDAALSILDDGKFKSQFESNRSCGSYDPHWRAVAEETGLGFPERGSPEKRPIYGYIVDGTFGADNYGTIEFRMKDALKDRTTITCTDSLGLFSDGRLVGAPVRAPDKIPSMDGSVGHLIEGKPPYDYIEAQIHGGVTVSDIESVVIHAKYMEGYQVRSMYERLAALGVPYTIDRVNV